MDLEVKSKERIKTPPLLDDNIYLIERLEELESMIDDKNEMIESMYKEIINLQNKIEKIEIKIDLKNK